MTASLFFLGLNPLFVSPRDCELNTVDRPKSAKKRKTKKQQKKIQKSQSKSQSKLQSKLQSKSSRKSASKPITKKDAIIPITPCTPNRETTPSSYKIGSCTRSETSMSISFGSNAESHDRSDIINDNDTVYAVLTKQRNDAIEAAQCLENELKQREVTFALKKDHFKQQIKKYKHTNNELETENINLKDEIEKLEDRLAIFEENQNLQFILEKRKKIKEKHSNSKTNQLPNYIQKEFKKQINKYNDKELPFIQHNRSQTETSSLSAGAVNVQFPQKPLPSFTHIRQLTTILEHKSIPLELITNSDDNINIHNEWNQNSVAQIIDKQKNCNNNNNKERDERRDLKEKQKQNKEHKNKEHKNKEHKNKEHKNKEHKNKKKKKNNKDIDDILKLQQNSRSVSYMSNNTIILNELSMESEESPSPDLKNKTLLNPPSDDLDIDHVDNIIKSPINISSNHSFRVRL